MDASPQTKWQERNDTYRMSTIKAGIDKAEANHKAAMGQTLPMIVMSGRQLRDVSSEVLEALVAAQEGDPYIFERTGRLCRIRFDENGSCSISSFVKDEEFRGVIGRVADFCVLTKRR